jgi:outer membrane immunogenic protein
MRKSLLLGICASALFAGSALAADLPLKAPPAPPPVPVFSWTGFYLGANIGGAWSSTTVTDQVTGANLSTDNNGFIGGGQIGFNYQVNNFVFGVEGDIDGTSISKTSNQVGTAFGVLQANASTDWVATLTGRIGIAFDRWMIYAKGGGAWVQNSVTLDNLTTGGSVSASNTNSGWVAGVGAEWAFSGPWSAKIEYNHLQFDDWSPSTNSVIVNDRINVSRDIDLVKFGINYRFGWAGSGGGYGNGGYGRGY